MSLTNKLLWIIYIALLGVLLPHTAWAFGQFEPAHMRWLGWVAAIAFEGAIAAFTWRLKENIENTPRHKSAWRRFRRRYLNIYSAGLVVAIAVSSAANWAHSVEFGASFAVFRDYSVAPILYSLAFGGILPLCSLLFARILADVAPAEHDDDSELAKARATIAEIRSDLRQAEARAATAEQRFAAAGDLVARLMAESKRDRILAAAERWPKLPAASIAVIAESSPSYVSEVLSPAEGERG